MIVLSVDYIFLIWLIKDLFQSTLKAEKYYFIISIQIKLSDLSIKMKKTENSHHFLYILKYGHLKEIDHYEKIQPCRVMFLRAEREARSESTSIYRRKVSMSGRPAGRGHALWTLISLERDDQFTNGHLNTMSPSNQSCIWPVPIPTGACHGTWHVPGRGCRRHPLPR